MKLRDRNDRWRREAHPAEGLVGISVNGRDLDEALERLGHLLVLGSERLAVAAPATRGGGSEAVADSRPTLGMDTRRG